MVTSSEHYDETYFPIMKSGEYWFSVHVPPPSTDHSRKEDLPSAMDNELLTLRWLFCVAITGYFYKSHSVLNSFTASPKQNVTQKYPAVLHNEIFKRLSTDVGWNEHHPVI